MTKRAVVLVSGGLDSATCLAMTKLQGFDAYALSFDYGQRHDVELQAAKRVVEQIGAVEHKVFHLDIGQFGGSALTDQNLTVPEEIQSGIPITYVPARNTIFLSIALGWAETLEAQAIFIGANAVDYSGYPDCRPEFIESFQTMANHATQQGVEGKGFRIETPLIGLTKAEIILCGVELGVDYSLTVSCYQATKDGHACGVCDSCRFRAKGFSEAGVIDPTVYMV